MADRIFVVPLPVPNVSPAATYAVPDVDSGGTVPVEGKWVTDSIYWQRRVITGEIEIDPDEPPEAVETFGSLVVDSNDNPVVDSVGNNVVDNDVEAEDEE